MLRSFFKIPGTCIEILVCHSPFYNALSNGVVGWLWHEKRPRRAEKSQYLARTSLN